MRLSRRYAKDSTPSIIRELSESELRTLFSNGPDHQHFLQEAYGFWFICECNLPVTIKRLRANNQYYLARVPGREEHESGCRFFSVFDELVDVQHQHRTANLNAFSFSHVSSDTPQHEPLQSTGRASKIARTDKLYALVAGLLETAKCNEISLARPPSFSREASEIIRASSRYTLGSKSLKEYIFLGFGKLSQAKKLLASRERNWIGRHKPQALLLGHVESVSKDDDAWVIHVKENWDVKLNKKCLVTRLNGVFSLNKGPLLVAAIVSPSGKDEQGKTEYNITRCFVSPVVTSTGFMIIDSNLERIAAKVAIKCLLTNKSQGTLIKPLTPTFIEGVAVLPDFLISHQGETKALEVMGKWDDDIYQERKSRTVPLMRSLHGEVLMVGNHTSKNPDEFYKECLWVFNKGLA